MAGGSGSGAKAGPPGTLGTWTVTFKIWGYDAPKPLVAKN